MSNKTIRPVLATGAPSTKLDDNTTIWGVDEQPWLDHGITMQVSSGRYNNGRSVHVASEAIDIATGEVLASTGHPACTHDAVRRIIAARRQAALLAA